MKVPSKHISQALSETSKDFFKADSAKSYGMGGSIPFLGQLGKKFPNTFIMALGLCGPNSNIHAPNEAMDIEFCKKLTCSLSHIIGAFGVEK